MASVPRGTPGLGEGRKVGHGKGKEKKKKITKDKKTRETVCSRSSSSARLFELEELNVIISMLMFTILTSVVKHANAI